MKPNDNNKRVTRVSPGQVALLQEALRGNGETGQSAPESKLTPGPLQPTKRPNKSPARPSILEARNNVYQSLTRLPAPQEQSKWDNDTSLPMVERHESPWETFEKGYECDLAGTVAVCIPLKGERAVRAIRQFSAIEADSVLQIVRSMNHDNVAVIQACYRTADALYTLSEFDPLTLDHIVACKQYPKPNQLASLMAQLLDGLAYLVAQGFRHTSLNCSSVLVGLNGELKIARLECCVARQADKLEHMDLAPVSRIMMELMQKYIKADGAVGIDNPERWKACPAAIDFLSATTSASSFKELKKVSSLQVEFKTFLTVFQQRFLTEIRSCPGDLVCLIWFALISARTFYS
ncbi:hypothetical protein N7478_012321 [Penicillium angulare]|uniref:uncharacterized protein n=1 Tax=Penicillium angulare TaxID=116970 RepID=UPI0025402331|nr:uncharacterized protein N7478_012321 [Penicillium angulare]KAJ5259340.1 hypothetical protein N7478_012321 [Penicillium angulare]